MKKSKSNLCVQIERMATVADPIWVEREDLQNTVEHIDDQLDWSKSGGVTDQVIREQSERSCTHVIGHHPFLLSTAPKR